MSLRDMDISTYFWKDRTSQSYRFRREKGHSRVPFVTMTSGAMGAGRPWDHSQRERQAPGLQSMRAAAWAAPSKAVRVGLLRALGVQIPPQCVQQVVPLPQWALRFWTCWETVTPFFFPFSPFGMGMSIPCLCLHCILETHNLFDFTGSQPMSRLLKNECLAHVWFR